MILLAPIRATGGISVWTRQVIRDWPGSLKVIDTSPLLRRPSQELNWINAPLALVLGVVVWVRAIAYAIFKKKTLWVTVSPSVGFRVRDVGFLLLCARLNIRTVVHIHGSLMSGLLGTSARSRSWSARGLLAAGEVVVLDKRTQTTIGNLTGRFPKVIPNFLDVPPASIPTRGGQGSILFAGRVTKEKGSDVLLGIANMLTGNQELVIVGPIDPAIDRSFRGGCRGLNVELVGEVAHNVVIERMKLSDLLVLPSHHEGFPMVVLEAMAMGLPVATTDVGACREMLVEGSERPAGVLFTNPRIDGGKEFVCGVHDLLLSAARLSELNGGRRRVLGRYTASHVIPKMVSIVKGAE